MLWNLGSGIVARWLERSRENRDLAQLDGRELRDIGLTRADVQMLLSRSIWHD